MKTTSPKKYCVRPNVGIVMPKSTCDFAGMTFYILSSSLSLCYVFTSEYGYHWLIECLTLWIPKLLVAANLELFCGDNCYFWGLHFCHVVKRRYDIYLRCRSSKYHMMDKNLCQWSHFTERKKGAGKGKWGRGLKFGSLIYKFLLDGYTFCICQ